MAQLRNLDGLGGLSIDLENLYRCTGRSKSGGPWIGGIFKKKLHFQYYKQFCSVFFTNPHRYRGVDSPVKVVTTTFLTPCTVAGKSFPPDEFLNFWNNRKIH